MKTSKKPKETKPAAKAGGWAWKPGARFPVKAPVAGKALEQVRRSNGGVLTPAAVVDAARHPDHPLHRLFEWDDTEAAESWRNQQARLVINNIRVTVTGGGVDRVAFVSVVEREHGRSYVPSETVFADADYEAQAVAEALAALAGWERRYAHLTELSAIFAAARQVRAKAA